MLLAFAVTSAVNGEVSGGVFPVVVFGLTLATRVGFGVASTKLVGHIGTDVGLGIATYSLCEDMGAGAY